MIKQTTLAPLAALLAICVSCTSFGVAYANFAHRVDDLEKELSESQEEIEAIGSEMLVVKAQLRGMLSRVNQPCSMEELSFR